MNLVTVKTFDNPIDAHLAKSVLAHNGVKSFLIDENMVALNPLFNVTVGGIKLRVPEIEVGKAHTVLMEMAIAPVTDEHDRIVTCPECHSPNFYQGYKSMKGAKGVLSAMISFVFMVFPVYFESVNKCKDCGFEFDSNQIPEALQQDA